MNIIKEFFKFLFKKETKDEKKDENKYVEKESQAISNEIKKSSEILSGKNVEEVIGQLTAKDKEYIEKVLKEWNIKKNNNKPTLLIVDDNEGLISLIEDILETSEYANKLNVLKISSIYAGFIFSLIQEKDKDLKIDYAIIDLSYGGVLHHEKYGNIRYEGISVFENVYKKNKDLKFFFYTGNNLNPYVYSSKKILDHFNSITNKDLKDYVVYKNQFPPFVLESIIMERLNIGGGKNAESH